MINKIKKNKKMPFIVGIFFALLLTIGIVLWIGLSYSLADDATCTHNFDGQTTYSEATHPHAYYKECNLCGKHIPQGGYETKAHGNGAWGSGTCPECGQHSWEYYYPDGLPCDQWKRCYCGANEFNQMNHGPYNEKYVSISETQHQTTYTCVYHSSYFYTRNEDHTFDDYTCTKCNYIYTRPLATPIQAGTLIYNGTSLTPTWDSYDPETFIYTVTPEINVGEYTATFTPQEHCCWADTQTNESRDISWRITPANAVTQAPTAITGILCDGDPHVVLNPGIAILGSFEYSNDGIIWSENLPTESDMGIHTVYWRFISDNPNYANVDSTPVTVGIGGYVTLSSSTPFSIRVADNSKHWNGSLKYSKDHKTWTEWSGTVINSESDGTKQVIYLCGLNNSVITGNSENNRWVLTGDNISCIGNIEDLLNYNAVALEQHPTMDNNCFYKLFSSNASLITAPELPGTIMSSNCYNSMFENCNNLAAAPALPALTLANSCYYNMFKGCTSIKTAPVLPATALADSCYYGMFSDCSSLENTPELKSMAMVQNCYSYMFSGCASITEAPQLSASTLAVSCYAYMFDGCLSLTNAPALPATTLAVSCYQSMFANCSSLERLVSLPAKTLTTNCYADMFNGCTNLEISTTSNDKFQVPYKIPVAGTGTSATGSLTNMFAGIKGPFSGTPTINTTYYIPGILPYATISSPYVFTLYCSNKGWDGTIEYSTDLFEWKTLSSGTTIYSSAGDGTKYLYLRGIGNTKLSSNGSAYAWQLKGTKIAIDDLEKIVDAGVVFNGGHPVLSNYAFAYLFYNCTGLVKAPPLPFTSLGTYSYYHMFDGCTGLTEAPALPATELTDYCYSYMFRNCTTLTDAPDLPAEILKPNCYSYMFAGCSNLINPPILSATTVASYSCDHMFSGCSFLQSAPELKATTLSTYCYSAMFQNCYALKQAPELPATSLASYCYQYMFESCLSLTTPPKLPATALSTYCYYYMFNSCSNIKLSSTQTTEYSIPYVVPSTGSGTNGTYSLSNMFTSTGGTFTGTPTINRTYYLVGRTDNYLTFSSDSSFTIKTANSKKNWNGTIEYSVDGENWTEWNGVATISSGAMDEKQALFVRGYNNTIITGNDISNRWVLSGSNNINLTGNTETLLNYTSVDAGNHPSMDDFCFAYMFYDCNKLSNVPELGSPVLSEYCYKSMFENCTAITNPAELPAKVLPEGCYERMFYNCTNIKLSNAQTAEYIAEYSIPYDAQCIAQENALTDMFTGTSGTFTGTPKINTNYYLFGSYAYIDFVSPTSFAIGHQSYKSWNGTLEYSVDKTNWVTYSGTTIYASKGNDNYHIYLRGSNNTRLSYQSTSANYYFAFSGTALSKVSCKGNIETLLDYKTVLEGNHPETDTYTFAHLFYQQTALIEAPILPATQLKNYAYYDMFYGCTNLLKVPELPATSLGTYCYSYMFYNCKALTLPASLKATELKTGCYQSMFYGCTNIRLSQTKNNQYSLPYRIPETGTGTTVSNTMNGMFTSTGGSFTGSPSINTTYYLLAPQGYISFESENSFTLSTKNNTNSWDGIIEYSTDGTNWTTWTGNIITSKAIDEKQSILLRGIGNTIITGQNSANGFVISGTNVISTGCIETLLDYKSVVNKNPVILEDYCFKGLFADNSELIVAPEFTATNLAIGCYAEMFRNCTALKQVPELPATTLPDDCYYRMFYGCSAIKLSEKRNNEYVYQYRIPANGTGIIHNNSVKEMFTMTGGEFASTPNINKTYYLTNGQNYVLFESTSSFTLTANSSYRNGTLEYSTDKITWATASSSMTSSPILRGGKSRLYLRGTGSTYLTNKSASTSYAWTVSLSDSSATIDCFGNIENLLDYKTVMFGKHPTMNTYAFAYMFYNWTRLRNAPELPFPITTDYCYYHMFDNCTNLYEAPALPATTLSQYCYSYMFNNCTRLNRTPALPATAMMTHCYDHMLFNCTYLSGTASLPATTLTSYCYYYMFSGAKAIRTPASLPATELATNCYAYMYSNCSSIKLSSTKTSTYTIPYRVPSSGTGITASNALSNMFSSTGGTFTGTPSINTTYYLYGLIDYITFISPDEFSISTVNNQKNWNGTIKYSTDLVDWTTWDGGTLTSALKKPGVAYSHTSNIDDTGKKSSVYSANNSITQVVTLPDADYLIVDIYYNSEGTNWDWACVWEGNHSSYDATNNYLSSVSGKLGGSQTGNYTVNGNSLTNMGYSQYRIDDSSVTFSFRSDGSGTGDGYGYYAIVTGYYNSTEIANVLYLRGEGNNSISGEDEGWVIDGQNVSCTGNILSLLDSISTAYGLTPEMSSYCFEDLFKGNSALITASTLTSEILSEGCYKGMFENCINLQVAPQLIAEELAPSCYESMFKGSGIVSAPELPAETLAESCYREMFSQCDALTEAPILKSTALASNCYRDIFNGCENLISVPVLPATTLEDSCYYGMFNGCSALTETPTLPALTMAPYAYAYMFRNCTGLTTPAQLPATVLADYCYQSMFEGCSGIIVSENYDVEHDIVFKNQTGNCSKAYSIPKTKDATSAENATQNMFALTGGSFTGTPDINRDYYLWKPYPTYSAPTAIANLQYNGTTNTNGSNQALVSGGTVIGGQLFYSLDNANWTASIPAVRNVGNYTVYWKIVGDEDHADVKIHEIAVSIAKKAIARVTASNLSLDYTVSGQKMQPDWNNYNSNTIDIDGVTEPQWCGGPYTTTFTPMSNFEWSTGNKAETISLTWYLNDKIAPTFSVTGSVEVNAAYATSRTISIIASDREHESGLHSTAYSYDGGLNWTNSSSHTYNTGDVGTVTIKVRDAALNESSQIVQINVDAVAPTVTISGGDGDWTAEDRTITITATDNHGLAPEPYSFDGGETWQSIASKTFTTTTNNVVIKCKDSTGNIYSTVVQVRIDKSAPVIISIDGQTTDFASSRTIIVNATDAESGIYQYSFDNGITWQISNTFTYIDSIKTQTIKVRDYALNEAVYENVNIYVDHAPPEALIYGTATEWSNEVRIITIVATDDISGLSDTPYSYDGGATWTAQDFYTVSTTTDYFKVLARDKANNILEKMVPVFVDRSGPSMTITGGSNTWALTRTITVSNAADAQTQLHEMAYSFDGGTNWTAENTRVFVETVDSIIVKVRDKFGNETAQTVSVKVDTTSPAFTVSGASTSWAQAKTFVITNATDTECGLNEAPYSFDGGISWSNSPSYTLNEGTTYYKTFAVRDKLGNISTQIVNAYVDAEAPSFAASYFGVDHNSYASVNTQFSATDLISNSFQYAINYNREHPEIAAWTNSKTTLLPIGVTTIVACRDEAGNIAVREFTPPYSLMPEDIDNRLVVFDDSALASAGYTLGPSDAGYLAPDGTHYEYSSYSIGNISIKGLLVPISVELNGAYADGYATFLGRKLDVLWDAELTAKMNVGAGNKTCFVLIDAADLTYSILQAELKIYITEYIDEEMNMPCNNTTKSAMMKIDIDAPATTIRYNISTKKCAITARDLLSHVKSLEYRFVDKTGTKSEWMTYYDKITLPDNTKYVEARSFDAVGNSDITRSEDLSTYTTPIVLTPEREQETIVLDSSYNYRTSLFEYFIIGI